MNVTEAYTWAAAQLKDTQSTSPLLDAEVLLCSIMSYTKENMVLNRFTQVPTNKIEKLKTLVKERKKGMPVAYLIGVKEFYGLKFKVNKHVLIPRPETETLVEKIVFEMKNKHNLKILDVGTGSGCIIISLAKTLSNNNKYYGSDESQRALGIAEENAKNHRVKIELTRSDLTRTTGTNYDVIVANLPYLESLTDASTEFEPKQALIAKKGGMELYERLFAEIAKSEHRPILYLEFGHDQAEQIKNLVTEKLFGANLEIFKDLSGIPRFSRIYFPHSNKI
jgi:release factor glutamine methyltransferase